VPPLANGPDEGAARASEERAWRTRVAQAQAKVDEAQETYDTLAGMSLVPGYEYVDEKGRPVVRSVGELQRLTTEAKARLDAAQTALDPLLEEARRARVPPGWLR
jgi:predicted deacetylase